VTDVQPSHMQGGRDNTDGSGVSPVGEAARPRPAIDVEVLLGGETEVRLRYSDEEHRLRITRNRKLILTK